MTYNFKEDLKLFVDLAHGRLKVNYLSRYVINDLYNSFSNLLRFVELFWHTLNKEDKDLIIESAYDVLAEEERLPAFRPLYWYQVFKLQGIKRKDQVRPLLQAHQDCLDEILSQIERDDPRFQAELEESLNQAIEYLNNNK